MKRLFFQLEGLGEIFLEGGMISGLAPLHVTHFCYRRILLVRMIREKGVEFVPDVMEARRYGPYLLDSKLSGTILENFGVPERP